jgi:hypothetical protein
VQSTAHPAGIQTQSFADSSKRKEVIGLFVPEPLLSLAEEFAPAGRFGERKFLEGIDCFAQDGKQQRSFRLQTVSSSVCLKESRCDQNVGLALVQ